MEPNISSLLKGNQAHSINTESHDNACGAGWDPSGRYYASFCTSEIRLELDAYKIYNCFGETILNEQMPKLTNVRCMFNKYNSGNGERDQLLYWERK